MKFSYIKRGNNSPCYKLTDLPVFFDDERCLPIIETVLDQEGNILSFPGVVEDKAWQNELRLGMHSHARFEAEFFALKDGRFLMLWLLQPDGMYWMDEDGFGMEADLSITMYTTLTKDAKFEKPFNLYCLDKTRLCRDFDEYVPNLFEM